MMQKCKPVDLKGKKEDKNQIKAIGFAPCENSVLEPSHGNIIKIKSCCHEICFVLGLKRIEALDSQNFYFHVEGLNS